MTSRYERIALRAGHRCEYCHAPEVVFNFPFEVEHILPLARGGDDSPENLALACRSCNLWKGAMINGVDPESGESIALYHPRIDVWEQHFAVDRANGVLIGRSAIGRASIQQLRMNHHTQQAARQQWMRLGLFP